MKLSKRIAQISTAISIITLKERKLHSTMFIHLESCMVLDICNAKPLKKAKTYITNPFKITTSAV
eukprot:TRINITY_DN7160_c0_g1_i1.p3 TRINITY_DN7160_c0_g1~~TRINITY_DN7160_c0_g1_i1.p3  ORF type:complete len:65 (+),score=9.87 TRINITY_DN7160_c0_g1_i1:582-776(+)